MSQAATFTSATTPRSATVGAGPLMRILVAAAALSALAGLTVTLLLDRVVDATEVPRLVPAPSLGAGAAPGVGTTVPDASEVFAGREVALESDAPTF